MFSFQTHPTPTIEILTQKNHLAQKHFGVLQEISIPCKLKNLLLRSWGHTPSCNSKISHTRHCRSLRANMCVLHAPLGWPYWPTCRRDPCAEKACQHWLHRSRTNLDKEQPVDDLLGFRELSASTFGAWNCWYDCAGTWWPCWIFFAPNHPLDRLAKLWSCTHCICKDVFFHVCLEPKVWWSARKIAGTLGLRSPPPSGLVWHLHRDLLSAFCWLNSLASPWCVSAEVPLGFALLKLPHSCLQKSMLWWIHPASIVRNHVPGARPGMRCIPLVSPQWDWAASSLTHRLCTQWSSSWADACDHEKHEKVFSKKWFYTVVLDKVIIIQIPQRNIKYINSYWRKHAAPVEHLTKTRFPRSSATKWCWMKSSCYPSISHQNDPQSLKDPPKNHSKAQFWKRFFLV